MRKKTSDKTIARASRTLGAAAKKKSPSHERGGAAKTTAKKTTAEETTAKKTTAKKSAKRRAPSPRV